MYISFKAATAKQVTLFPPSAKVISMLSTLL